MIIFGKRKPKLNLLWTPKWMLFTGVFRCNNLSDLLVIFLILISFICCFLNYTLGILKIFESMFSICGTGLTLCVIPWSMRELTTFGSPNFLPAFCWEKILCEIPRSLLCLRLCIFHLYSFAFYSFGLLLLCRFCWDTLSSSWISNISQWLCTQENSK